MTKYETSGDLRSQFGSKTAFSTMGIREFTRRVAADAEWPHTEEENRGVRKEFVLPLKRSANA